MLVVVCLVLLSLNYVQSEGEGHTIGGIFYKSSNDLKEAFTLSAKMYNFTTSIKEVSRRGEILEISRHVCSLAEISAARISHIMGILKSANDEDILEKRRQAQQLRLLEGVVGIVDGTGGRASENIQALCDMLELPHIVIQHNDLYCRNWSLLNLYPSPEVYNNVLEKLIIHKGWRNFTILYVKGYSVVRVSELMKIGTHASDFTVTVRELSGEDYRDVLINAKQSKYTNFVVDCPSRYLEQLLRHAQQVGLMAEEHSYIFVSPDLFTLDMTRYRYGGVNMTGFRLVELKNNERLWNFTAQYNEATGESIESDQMKTKVILIHDAVQVFAAAIEKVKHIETMQLSCENYDSWIYGSSLLNFMRTNKVEGITRTLLFDGYGQRTDVIFDLLELTPAGNQTIGTWEKNKLTIARPLIPDAEIGEESILRNKTLRVLISTTAPYGYVKESANELVGNDRYEGFTVDLIDKLSEILGFNYEFDIESDYGSLTAGKWSGMVLQLREEKADLAICDLTITAQRQSGIDFSTPFMTLGIGILYKEPSKQPPEMFSFMAVFSKEVWYYMMLIQFLLGVVMIIVGRLSNKEWQNPVPCIEQPETLTNQFSFANSVWLIIGSVMQQGSEIAPIALAPRMITSVWWFFTMVMVASYVGILVAFLTVEKNVLPFETVDELFNHKFISYGAKEKGTTISFFKDSNNPTYKKMYKKMYDKGWLVKENDVGVALAENTTYAFFMESTSIEYYKERHCDLLLVGDLLDSKSYGIGMKKKSPYKRYIDDALLKLKEKGEIQKLKDIWWKEKKGGGKCGEKLDADQKQLGMKNLLGAFVVLGVGCFIGVIISILDMLWGVFKRSVKYSTTFKFELVEELKFALKFSGNVKQVKRIQKSDGSGEALALTEGKDELHSLRSGRSTSTHRTHHSHSSRHSSRCLSVAFAKRRKYS